MISIYDSKTVNFDNNGLGSLRDMISCVATEELNGTYDLEAEYPLTSQYIELIKNENIIKCDSGYETEQLFRIKRCIPNLKTVKIYGNHITYDLKDNNLEDVYPQKLNCNNALNWILNRTQFEHPFKSFSDISKTATARYVNVNPLSAILGDRDNSFINLYGGELVRDNFTIKLLQNRGVDNGYKISKRKNLVGLSFDEDNTNVVTRIRPKGYNGISLPETYVDSPLINNYPHPKISEIEFTDVKLKSEESEDGFDTLEEVYEELRKRANAKFNEDGIDRPAINVKVNFVELSKTQEYKNYKNLETIKLGDYVDLIFNNYDIKLKVIKTKYNVLLKRYIEIELGQAKTNFLKSTGNSISQLNDKIKDIDSISILNAAKTNATDQINKALGGYVYKTQNELFIMDSKNPQEAIKVWRWNINGLGYSKDGINGPYQTAATSDGSLVADMITSGTLNTNVIDGYNELLLRVFKNSNNLEQLNLTIDGIVNTTISSGGSNILKNPIGNFNNDYWEGTGAESYTDTHIQNKTGQRCCWLLNNGSHKQTIQTKNGNFTLSFMFEKIIELANVQLKINNIPYEIKEETSITFNVTDNNITIEFISDVNKSAYVMNLMLNEGTIAQVYSNNPNETITDTVKIGKGIKISATGANAELDAQADGIRIKNTMANQTKTEFTDKGTKTDELEANKATIAKILIADTGNQTWVNRL